MFGLISEPLSVEREKPFLLIKVFDPLVVVCLATDSNDFPFEPILFRFPLLNNNFRN